MFRKKINNIKKVLIVFLIILFGSNIVLNAHGGNITGWKEKDSKSITRYKDKYYGYHKENGNLHYHEVKWNEEESKWEIVNPAVYYNENFEIISNKKNSSKSKKENRIEVKFIRKVDGDTAKFYKNNKEITVRFLGINTPETVDKNRPEEPFGKEASEFTQKSLENAKKIEIEYDKNAQKKDKYGRDLAWVWVDDKLLQEQIVSNGLAKIYMLQNNYMYASELQLAQEHAKSLKVGLWSDGNNAAFQNNSQIENKNVKEEIINNILRIIVLILVLVILIIVGNKKIKLNDLKKINNLLKKKKKFN